jgi:hypothetical protein
MCCLHVSPYRISRLITLVWQFSRPGDIIDRVCSDIENDPDWLSQNHSLVEHINSQGKSGRLTVNSSISWFTIDLTGMINMGEGRAPDYVDDQTS